MVRGFALTMMLAGISLCGILVPPSGKGEFSPSLACPPLPKTAPAGQVSIYVAKAQNRPGFVCVRVINGRSEDIGFGAPPTVTLQRWKKEKPGESSQFRDFLGDYPPPGRFEVQQPLLKWYFPPGTVMDEQVPMFRPAPPGRYRVCFPYDVGGQGARGKQVVCSEEFTLP